MPGSRKKRDPSRGDRYDWGDRNIRRHQGLNKRVDQLRPYPTGGSFFKRIPGNKLPGYHHLVPSGQQIPGVFWSQVLPQRTGVFLSEGLSAEPPYDGAALSPAAEVAQLINNSGDRPPLENYVERNGWAPAPR